jgi:hypothetical protein
MAKSRTENAMAKRRRTYIKMVKMTEKIMSKRRRQYNAEKKDRQYNGEMKETMQWPREGKTI